MLENTKGMKKIKTAETLNKTNFNLKDIISANIKDIVLYLICIFVSRSSIIGELFPCSIAFLCAYYYVKGPSVIALIVTVLSIISVKLELKYILLCVFIYVYYLYIKKKKRSVLLFDIFGFSIILLTINTVIMMYNGFKLNIFLINLFETMFIISSTFIIREVIIAVKRNTFNVESTACLLALIFISVLGFREIQLLDFNILMYLIFFSIIFVSSYISPFAGMILGIAFGFFNYTKLNISAYYMLALGFGGMSTGLIKNKYKPLSGILFIIVSSLILIYFKNINLYLENLSELGLAIITYTIISFSFNDKLNNLISAGDFYEKKANEAIFKLTKLSSAINELSLAYKEHSAPKLNSNEKNIEAAVSNVNSSMCTTCEGSEKCWQKNHNRTYYSLIKTANNISKNKNTADDYLKSQCSNYRNVIKEMYKSLKNTDDSPKVNKESVSNNEVVLSQLRETSEIINDAIVEMSYVDIKSKTAKNRIEEIVSEEEIIIKSFDVSEIKNNLGVVITLSTEKNLRDVCDIISSSIKKITGLNMKCTEKIVSTDKYYILRFNMLQKISAKAYYSKLTKENSQISGDNYSYGTSNNKFYGILCDGMGTGARAFNESKSAISLLTKLLDANFNEKQMISTLNSLLLLKLDEDRYVTLDFSVIDLDTHELRTYKAGAAQSYLISNNEVIKIQSSSLPIGILDSFECYNNRFDIKPNDIFIMMTDGIVDSINEDEQKSLDKYLELIKNKDPQSIANTLLTYAIRGCNKIIDDMTVLVIKIV